MSSGAPVDPVKLLACHDGKPTPEEFHDNLRAVYDELLRVQAVFHGRILILSGYRSRSWNRKIGGAKFSQHMHGRAVDIAPADPSRLDELRRAVLSLPELDGASRVKGIGYYPTFVHLDIRPGKQLLRWDGKRLAADAAI